jgi:hypothetical protein
MNTIRTKALTRQESLELQDWITQSGLVRWEDFDVLWKPILNSAPTLRGEQESEFQTVIHRPTNRRCQFYPSPRPQDPPELLCEYLGRRERTELSRGTFGKREIDHWLTELKNEVAYWERDDPWERVWSQAASRDWTSSFSAVEDRPFRPEETEEIKRLLIAFREEVAAQFELTADQLAGIDYANTFLVVESGRASRVAWLMLVYGMIGGWLLTVVVPSELARQLLIELLRVLAASLFPDLHPPSSGQSLLA